MNIVLARVLFLAFVGLTGMIIYNALYLQDLQGTSPAKLAAARAAKPDGQAAPDRLRSRHLPSPRLRSRRLPNPTWRSRRLPRPS